MAWRTRRWLTTVMVLLVSAVVVPAAAHAFWAAGTTPGRYLVAIVPILLLFVSDAASGWSRRRLFLAAFMASAIVSVQTATRYNLHHVKEIGPIVAREFAGWRPGLLFPSLGTETWTATGRDVLLLCLWVVAGVLLVRAGLRSDQGAVPADTSTSSRWQLRDVAAALLVLSMLGAAASIGAQPLDREYMVPAKTAREEALAMFASLRRCAACYSSIAGAVAPTDALGNEAAFVDIQIERPPVIAGTPVLVRVRPRTSAGEYVVATVRVEFGDGGASSSGRVFGDVEQQHVFAQPGQYIVHAWVRGTSGGPVETRTVVDVIRGATTN
jgi:hypothetical protein